MILLLACQPKDDLPVDDTGSTDTSPDETGPDETGPDDTGPDDTGDTGNGTPWSDEVLDGLRSAMRRDLRNSEAFAGQVAIWYEGEVVWTEAVGTRTADGKEEVDTDTLFQIGSDTKKLAALVLLQAVERGELSLDQSVADALPALDLVASPGWAKEATLHHLISHQGGLYDYTPWDNAPDDAELATRAYGAFAERGWAMAPPGRMWNYANPNFSLAGLVVEEATGRPWADVVEEDVFAPLGMSRSFARLSEVLDDGNVGTSWGVYDFEADGFDIWSASTYEYGEATPEQVGDNGFTRPAGLVWSTAADHARLLGFLIDGDPTLLSDSLRAEMAESQVPLYPSYPRQGYGYGLMRFDGFNLGSDYYDVPLLAHGGNTLTYTSTTYLLPEQRWAISILSNAYGDAWNETLLEAFENTVPLPAPSAQPSGDWEDETDHALLVGTYEDPALGTIEVVDTGGDLVVTIPSMVERGYDGSATLAFQLKDTYVGTFTDWGAQEFTFVPDEHGAYLWVRNRLFVGTRAD